MQRALKFALLDGPFGLTPPVGAQRFPRLGQLAEDGVVDPAAVDLGAAREVNWVSSRALAAKNLSLLRSMTTVLPEPSR